MYVVDDLEAQVRRRLSVQYEDFVNRKSPSFPDQELNDEDWWKHFLEGIAPSRRELYEEQKELFLESRKSAPRLEWTPEMLEQIIESELKQLMPEVIAVRGSSTGTLTDDEFHQAHMLATNRQIELARNRFRESAASTPPGHRKDVLSLFAENIAMDQEDLRLIQATGASEQDVNAASERIAARLDALTNRILSRRKSPE